MELREAFLASKLLGNGGGGGGETETTYREIIEGTISASTVSLPGVTAIGPGRFMYAKIENINLPDATVIGSYAFSSIFSLRTISAPKVSTVEYHAFYQDQQLNTVYMPMATYISDEAFYQNNGLSSVVINSSAAIGPRGFQRTGSLAHLDALSTISSIGVGAFLEGGLTSVEGLNLISVGQSAFQSCKSLLYANLPIFSGTLNATFASCVKLASVNVPNASSLNMTFYSCSVLPSVRFDNVQTISQQVFVGCRSLSAVYILPSSVPSLTYANAFNSCPISNSALLGYYGSIYVRASLLDAYKAAQNWSLWSARLVGLTDEEIAALPI